MRPTGPQGLIRRRLRMRARAGRAASAPGAIARTSQRIDILCPLQRRLSVAENGKRNLNPRATDGVSLAEARGQTQVRDFARENVSEADHFDWHDPARNHGARKRHALSARQLFFEMIAADVADG